MSAAIVVEGLSKQFYRYHPERPKTLRDALKVGLGRLKPIDRFWALDDISFTVASGRMVGVIGRNGAGKSTLLRLIGGVGRPDKGSLRVHGRIGALLELGTGFHPELSGRENVFVAGVIAGLTRGEIAERFDAIVDFAELQESIYSPLRTYSTGMQMRLAFAIAVYTTPTVLLIDEVLAVGDLAFQRKCLQRIAQFKQEGCTIFLVSHDLAPIRALCDEVVWLRKGKIAAQGEPTVVVGQYLAEMEAETRRRTPATRPVLRTPGGVELRVNENRFGTMEMEIAAVRLLDLKGLPLTELGSGDGLQVEIEYVAPCPIDMPIFGVTLSKEEGQVCYDTSTESAGVVLPVVQGHGKIVLRLDRLDLVGGQYYVDVGIYERNWTFAFDYHWHAYPLLIRSNGGQKGLLCPPHSWEVNGVQLLKMNLPIERSVLEVP